MSDASAAILAAFVAAGAALFVGWLQYSALVTQTRIAAFDKRYRCFELTQQALSIVLREGKVDGEATAKMIQAFQASWFVFPKELTDRLERTYHDMLQVRLHHALMDTPDSGKSRADHVRQKFDALKRVTDELAVIRATFAPYMHIEPRQHPLSWIDDMADWIEGKPN